MTRAPTPPIELTDEELEEFLDLVATQFSKGTADVSPADLKKLMPLIKHYAKMAHPWTACFKDQVKNGLSEGHARARCSIIKDLIRGSTRWRGEDDKKKADTSLVDLGFDEDWTAEAEAALGGLSDDDVLAMMDAALNAPKPGEVFVLDSALSPGDAVEWGEGDGKGRGIVMEVDTSTGNVNVHTCEIVTEGGFGEQLSPTGKTMKIDGGKLRKIGLKVVGTERVGPEQASMSEVPDAARANAARGLFLGRESHPEVPPVAVALADGSALNEELVAELCAYFDGVDLADAGLSDEPDYLMHGGDAMLDALADLAGWDESKHPRGKAGKFASVQGGFHAPSPKKKKGSIADNFDRIPKQTAAAQAKGKKDAEKEWMGKPDTPKTERQINKELGWLKLKEDDPAPSQRAYATGYRAVLTRKKALIQAAAAKARREASDLSDEEDSADLMLAREHRPPDIVQEDLMYQLESLTSAYRVSTRNGDEEAASALHGLMKRALDQIEAARKTGEFSADDWDHAVGLVDGIPGLADLASGGMFGGKKAPPFAKAADKDAADARKPAGGSKDGKLDTKKVSALGKGDVVVLGSEAYEVQKVVKDGDRVKFWVDGSNKTYSYAAGQTVFVRRKVDMASADDNPFADLSLQLPVVPGPAVPAGPDHGLDLSGSTKKWIKQILPFAKVNYKGRVLDFSKKFGEQLVANFKKKPFDQVPFFKVDKDNRHNSDPDNFRGELSDLMLKNDGVYAVVETNEQGTEHLTKVNPKLGTSVRVRFDWTRPADTKKYGPVLEHLAGTTLPHVPNLKPFQPVELSDAPVEPGAADGVLDLTGYEFSIDEGGGAEGESESGTQRHDAEREANRDKEVTELTTEIDLSQVPEELRPTIQALVDGQKTAEADKKTATDLAQEAMSRLQAAEERARRAEVESRLTDMTNEGVPPFMVDLARPLLLDAEYGAGEIVVDMADDGNGGSTEVKGRRDEQVWKLLSGAKGSIRFGEQGSGANGGSADFAGGGKSPDEMDDDELFAAWQQLREGEGE